MATMKPQETLPAPQTIPKTEKPEAEWTNRQTMMLVGCVVGIMGSLLTYGVVQERIMTQPFGEDKAMFEYSAFLVLNNRVVAVLVALTMLLVQGNPIRNVAPLYNYFGISISNVLATYCQYEALKFVSFPTQTLGKCGKIIPVMVLGTLISGKKYGWKDYVVAAMITVGCTAFALTGDISGKAERTDSAFGLILMGGYLFMDGFTSTFQEKLFKGYKMTTYNQMLYVNICSGIMSAVFLAIRGELLPAVQFAISYPDFLFQAFILSMCAAFSQLCIYYTIKTFGALIFATIMTTRQFMGILLSCFLYLHPLSVYQWLSSVVVFGAIYYKKVLGRKKK